MTHCGSKKIFEITLDEDIRDIHTYAHSRQRIRFFLRYGNSIVSGSTFFSITCTKRKSLTHKAERTRIFTSVIS